MKRTIQTYCGKVMVQEMNNSVDKIKMIDALTGSTTKTEDGEYVQIRKVYFEN